jgi:hypothetical protein
VNRCEGGRLHVGASGPQEESTYHGKVERFVAVVAKRRAIQSRLETGGPVGIADGAVRRDHRERIERAARRHPEASHVPSSEVLDRGPRSCPLDAQAPHRGTSWTRSPVANRQGGEEPGSKKPSSVRPIRFQPPGLADG